MAELGGANVAKDRVDRDEEDLVRLYLSDIGQYALLTKEDEVRLAQQIEAGNDARAVLAGGGKQLTPAKRRELSLDKATAATLATLSPRQVPISK